MGSALPPRGLSTPIPPSLAVVVAAGDGVVAATGVLTRGVLRNSAVCAFTMVGVTSTGMVVSEVVGLDMLMFVPVVGVVDGAKGER